MTPDEYRAFRETDLGDVPLQALLDAAALAVSGFLGDVGYDGERTEYRDGGSRIILLSRRPALILSVTETVGQTVTELAADDYLSRSDGLALERLSYGTNPPVQVWGVSGAWSGRVEIKYTLADDAADQERVIVGLVGLDIDRGSGATSFTIGKYSEGGQASAALTYGEARTALLNSLLTAVWTFS